MDHRVVTIENDPHKYGVPSQKKFPMPDAAHVRSAIRFFNYVDPAHEKELARAILKRMKEYGLTFNDFTVGNENRFSKYIPQPGELVHHGILGQKWGVRRFQNVDGTLTEAGKRRNAKELSKMSDKKEMAKSIESKITLENAHSLRSAYSNYKKMFEKRPDFFESKEAKEAEKTAYNDTKKWFENNDPDYLKTIIKNNNGKDSNLDAFHDFRKVFEGNLDTAWNKAEKQFNTRNGINLDNDKKVIDAYIEERRKVAESLIGKYGDTKMKNLPDMSFHEKQKLVNVVNDILDDYVEKQK